MQLCAFDRFCTSAFIWRVSPVLNCSEADHEIVCVIFFFSMLSHFALHHPNVKLQSPTPFKMKTFYSQKPNTACVLVT